MIAFFSRRRRMNWARESCPPVNYSRDKCSRDKYPRDKCPRDKCPREEFPWRASPLMNFTARHCYGHTIEYSVISLYNNLSIAAKMKFSFQVARKYLLWQHYNSCRKNSLDTA